jgi:hypothetical protein
METAMTRRTVSCAGSVRSARGARNRGAAAVMAMLFLVLITTLSVAMFALATGNVQTASNLADLNRAQAAAEAGIRWIGFRFVHMARPKTTIGNITPAVAESLWPQLQDAIVDDLTTSADKMLDPAERVVTEDPTSITTASISTEADGAKFAVSVRLDPDDARYLNVISTGTYRQATRSVSMRFKIDKKIRYAVVGKVPIQLGRNTIVEGPVAMATPGKYPPLLMLSDFMHFDETLSDQLEAWNTFLQGSHNGYDNRVNVNNPVENAAATAAGYSDVNGDAYIDEYDLFLARFDSNGDKAIDSSEFTNPSTGKLYDGELFKAIDSINGPMFDGDPTRVGFQDGKIDNNDGYAKVRGNIQLACTADAWDGVLPLSGYPGMDQINDFIQGTIAPTQPGQAPVEFGVSPSDMVDLDPANFEDCAANFQTQSGTAAGASVDNPTYKENLVLTAAMANASAVTERTPYGSTSYQATYKRPVFKDMTFKNVQIPKGLNALFDNCTFEGVTFVEGQRDITTSSGSVTYDKNEGMNWSKRRLSGDTTFSKDKVLLGSGTATSGQMITRGSRDGNNIRFNNCTVKGPLAGNYATAYTHFANSWEFTGTTMFDNEVDQTATIVSPQVNIEMGSFTNPSGAPSTMIGVVVAGNIDIRGTSNVDGSIIITGDGAGNTTLAYFGASDASTDPGAPMPEGGWGRLNIRYNPNRALPDGINHPIEVLPVSGTYSESSICVN